ncbi:MAG: ester cyclase [Pseudomonadota bacterium]
MREKRAAVRTALMTLVSCPADRLADAAEAALTADVVAHCAFPIGTLEGRDAVIEGFLKPLRAALLPTRRRDEIFIGGDNRRSIGGYWTASVTHYIGCHRASFCGAEPSGKLAFLRSGEFHEVADDGRIRRAHILFDLPDLMRQAGRSPFPLELGTEMLFPSPETHDGVCPPPAADDALTIVERMFAGLHAYDPKTFASEGQVGANGTWADDFMWYGPGGIGSNMGWDGFVRDHRSSFLVAFPDRKGGNHYCRISDGNYAAVSGWPSMTMTHAGPYLGLPATQNALTLNVMDFYRVADGKIAENWVFLDYGDLYRQMGGDLFGTQASAPAMALVGE